MDEQSATRLSSRVVQPPVETLTPASTHPHNLLSRKSSVTAPAWVDQVSGREAGAVAAPPPGYARSQPFSRHLSALRCLSSSSRALHAARSFMSPAGGVLECFLASSHLRVLLGRLPGESGAGNPMHESPSTSGVPLPTSFTAVTFPFTCKVAKDNTGRSVRGARSSHTNTHAHQHTPSASPVASVGITSSVEVWRYEEVCLVLRT